MKYNKSAKEVICFFLAFLIAFFTIQINFSVPDEETEKACETALQQYLKAPLQPLTSDIKISIKNTKITATIPYSFVYSTANLGNNTIYEIETHTYIIAFVLTQITIIVLFACLLYTILLGLVSLFTLIAKRTLEFSVIFFKYATKQFEKIDDYFKKKRMQKQLKEYENPEYQRVYQIGYNAGYANGFSDGTLNADKLGPGS